MLQRLLNTLTVRGKLAAVALPLVVALAATTVVGYRAQRAEDLRRAADRAVVVSTATWVDATTAVAAEWAATLGAPTEPGTTRAATDAALASLGAPEVTSAVEAARRAVEDGDGDVVVLSRFEAAAEAALAARPTGTPSSATAALAVERAALLAEASVTASHLAALLEAPDAPGPEIAVLTDRLDDTLAAWASLAGGDGDLQSRIAPALTTLTDAPGDDAPAAAAELTTVLSGAAAGDLAAAAAGLGAGDPDRATMFAITAALLVIIAAGLAIGVSRSLTVPLLTLADHARRSASQMPALLASLEDPDAEAAELDLTPVEVSGTDEVAELAGAFREMQDVIRRVAVEQADLLRKGISDLYVTLARRTQRLIDRQLDLLDELESREEDPARLAQLYRLDHMTTRMRRNAESLLVLAGADTHRRVAGVVELGEVVRAAAAEIDDYERVDVHAFEPVAVTGPAATDVVHLLAELLENATAFSAPETLVAVTGRRIGDGYRITVTDRGLGMSAERIAQVNRQLAEPRRQTLGLGRAMGFTVVGLLAARHGIRVTLSANTGGGITATVELPAALLAPAAPDSPAVERRPAVRADDAPSPTRKPDSPTVEHRPAVRADDAPSPTRKPDSPTVERRPAVRADDAPSPTRKPDRPTVEHRPAVPADDAPSPTPVPSAPGPLPRRTRGRTVPDAGAPGAATRASSPPGGGRPGGPASVPTQPRHRPGPVTPRPVTPLAGQPLPRRRAGVTFRELEQRTIEAGGAAPVIRPTRRTPEEMRAALQRFSAGMSGRPAAHATARPVTTPGEAP